MGVSELSELNDLCDLHSLPPNRFRFLRKWMAKIWFFRPEMDGICQNVTYIQLAFKLVVLNLLQSQRIHF